jgi:hypothetical protein
MSNEKHATNEPFHDQDDSSGASDAARSGGGVMRPTGIKLILETRLHSKLALDTIREELNKGRGVLAACKALKIGRTSMYRAAGHWPALAKMLESKAMDRDSIAAAGVKARNRVRRMNRE